MVVCRPRNIQTCPLLCYRPLRSEQASSVKMLIPLQKVVVRDPEYLEEIFEHLSRIIVKRIFIPHHCQIYDQDAPSTPASTVLSRHSRGHSIPSFPMGSADEEAVGLLPPALPLSSSNVVR